MIFDEILARTSQVHRVPVHELISQGLQFALVNICLVFFTQKHEIEEIVIQVFRLDPHGSGFMTLHISLQVMGNRVISHINGRIRQRFDQILGVPG